MDHHPLLETIVRAIYDAPYMPEDYWKRAWRAHLKGQQIAGISYSRWEQAVQAAGRVLAVLPTSGETIR